MSESNLTEIEAHAIQALENLSDEWIETSLRNEPSGWAEVIKGAAMIRGAAKTLQGREDLREILEHLKLIETGDEIPAEFVKQAEQVK